MQTVKQCGKTEMDVIMTRGWIFSSLIDVDLLNVWHGIIKLSFWRFIQIYCNFIGNGRW